MYTVNCSIHSLFIVYSAGGLGAPPPNKLKTWTRLDPKTTNIKNAMRVGLTRGPSSSRSATLPGSTFPRLVMFLSNFLFRLRMFLGSGCVYTRIFEKKKGRNSALSCHIRVDRSKQMIILNSRASAIDQSIENEKQHRLSSTLPVCNWHK